MIAAGGLLVLVALGYLLLRGQAAGHGHAADRRLESDERAYEKWVNGVAAGLGDRPAVVILEPDALAQLNGCPDNAQRQARLQMLSYAVKTLQTTSDQVYLDAGHSNWVSMQPVGRSATRPSWIGIWEWPSGSSSTPAATGRAALVDEFIAPAARSRELCRAPAGAHWRVSSSLTLTPRRPTGFGPIPATPGCKRSDSASRTSRQQSGSAHGAVTSPLPCRATLSPRPRSTRCRSWSRMTCPISTAAAAAPQERDSGATPPAGSLVRSRKCSMTAATWASGSRHPVSPMAAAASVPGPRRASSHPSSPRT